ncbi:MAG: coenzyme F420-0:L-glutamate ligase [Patescibacteria group bacterium]
MHPDPISSTKAQEIIFKNKVYERILIRTPRIDAGSDLGHIIIESYKGEWYDGDILCIAESVVAISQHRAYKISDITPGFTARLLARFVQKTPQGIGLGMSETMQLALEEIGYLRLYSAAIIGGITKLLGRRGDFYRIAGEKARGIDGPTSNTLPPYNEYATLLPKDPQKVVDTLEAYLTEKTTKRIEIIIVDANDIGVNIIGARSKEQEALGKALCADNPMGQGHEQTPILLARVQDKNT